MRYQRKIGNNEIIAKYDDGLDAQVKSLFVKLSELNEKGPALRDGIIIRFGWSDLRLSGENGELFITEPDFNGNPFRDHLPQVTITLKVLAEQASLLNETGVDGMAAYFADKVIIAKDCLDEEEVYLERAVVDEEKDSGWYIGAVDEQVNEEDEKELEAVYVFQIFQKRPALMKALAFPPGYLIVFKGDSVGTILNNRDEKVGPV